VLKPGAGEVAAPLPAAPPESDVWATAPPVEATVNTAAMTAAYFTDMFQHPLVTFAPASLQRWIA
jgi:hypothetical protein